MSYGIHAGADEIFAVVGLESPDADGVPTLGLLSEELLVHELAHSYVNPIVHAHLDELEGSSPALAAAVDALDASRAADGGWSDTELIATTASVLGLGSVTTEQ